MSEESTETTPDFAGQAREAHRAIAAIHEQAQQRISQVTMDERKKPQVAES